MLTCMLTCLLARELTHVQGWGSESREVAASPPHRSVHCSQTPRPLSLFPPLCLRLDDDPSLEALLRPCPCLASYKETSKAAQPLSPGARPEQGLSSSWVSGLQSPGRHLSDPLTTPTLGHILVTGLTLVTPGWSVCQRRESGWAGEPSGLTFLGTVMTMGSHLRSCSL